MHLARRAALVLALGLVAVVGLSAAGPDPGHARQSENSADTAFVTRADALQAAAARIEREHRRESLASHRSLKHVLAAAVLLAALGMASGLGVRRAVAGTGFRPPLTSWWFRSGGRAPPSFQLSVV